MRSVIAILAVLLLTWGCKAPEVSPDLLTGTWISKEEGPAQQTPSSQEHVRLTIRFENDSVAGGSLACNAWFGGYSVNEPGLMEFQPIATTYVYCGETLLEWEADQLRFLQAVNRYHFKSGNLVLLSDSLDQQMSFEPEQ